MSDTSAPAWFLTQVGDEVQRAELLFPGQEQSVDLPGWLSILTEEVGEVARALNERMLGTINDRELYASLTTELIQVAAMTVKMHRAAQVQLSEVAR